MLQSQNALKFNLFGVFGGLVFFYVSFSHTLSCNAGCAGMFEI
jgi:hypothetical protein